MGKLDGKKVAFLATDGVEQVELTEPWKAVEQEGGQPELVSLEEGQIQGFNHLDKADTFDVDRAIADASADDYDGLVVPGGVANPDFMRMDENAVQFVRATSKVRVLAVDVLRGRQARGSDLPRAVDAGRGGRGARPRGHLVAQPRDGHQECRRQLGGRGGRRGRRPRHQPQARRPSRLL